MNDAGHDEVPQVVGLEVQAVGKGIVLLGARRRSHHCVVVAALLFVLFLVQFGNDDWRVDVAIEALCLLDEANETVHDGLELWVVVDGIDGGHRF